MQQIPKYKQGQRVLVGRMEGTISNLEQGASIIDKDIAWAYKVELHDGRSFVVSEKNIQLKP
jgi:hypothetical protein